MNKRNEDCSRDLKLIKVKNGKYFIKWPDLDVPLILNKYLFDRLVEDKRLNTPKALAKLS